MRKTICAASCALLLATSNLTLAADPFEAEIKARQAFMQILKFNIGVLGDMAKGNRDYDAKLAENSAKNIQAASQMNNGAMWPMGSDNTNAKLSDKTKALPENWSAYPKAAEKHKVWSEASTVLAANAGNGLDQLRKHIGPLGKSCKGCHESFRAED